MSDDLVAFLLARIAEDEQVARKNTDGHGLGDEGNFPDYRTYDGADIDAADEFIGHFTSVRVLAECEAKRRIVDELHVRHGSWKPPVCSECGYPGEYPAPWPCPTLRLLVLPYRNHPDCQQEWNL